LRECEKRTSPIYFFFGTGGGGGGVGLCDVGGGFLDAFAVIIVFPNDFRSRRLSLMVSALGWQMPGLVDAEGQVAPRACQSLEQADFPIL
jgi:hypothetical protein